MKKLMVSIAIVIVFLLYSVLQKGNTADTKPVVLSDSSSLPTPTGGSPSPIATKSDYRDGTYTGGVADAFYGNIQVRATINGGKLTNIEFLQYPNDRHESIEINTQAMPILSQEAIQAQSASVDIVSGATDTSEAFIQSLQSALSQS